MAFNLFRLGTRVGSAEAKPHATIAGLHHERERFVRFAFATSQLLIETDRDGRICFAAGASFGLAKGGAETLAGMQFMDLLSDDDREFGVRIFERIASGKPSPLVRIGLRTLDGSPLHFLLGGCPLEADPGRIHLGLILADGLAQASPGDLDTPKGLAEAAAERLTIAAKTGQDESLTLYVMEGLSKLAATNPDRVAAVMEAIRAYLRSISVAGDLVGSVAPGKFGFIRAAGVTEAEIHLAVARILEQAGLQSSIKSVSFAFDTKTLGDQDAARALAYTISRFCDDAPSDFTLTSLADGANRLVSDTVAFLTHARAVMADHAIDVVFQPVVDMQAARTHHLEALSRVGGVASIGQWMQQIEESGLSEDYDLVLLDIVRGILKTQAKTGWKPVVAINLSARSLNSDIFCRRLMEALDGNLELAKQLMFELTETAEVGDMSGTGKFLQSLRKRGHPICLDDVGAGTTSFESLMKLPADYMKLDGSLVRNATRSSADRPFIKALSALAKSKGCEIIAEHIETKADARFSVEIGARFGQGYFFGRPSADVGSARHMRFAKIIEPGWKTITGSLPRLAEHPGLPAAR